MDREALMSWTDSPDHQAWMDRLCVNCGYPWKLHCAALDHWCPTRVEEGRRMDWGEKQSVFAEAATQPPPRGSAGQTGRQSYER